MVLHGESDALQLNKNEEQRERVGRIIVMESLNKIRPSGPLLPQTMIIFTRSSLLAIQKCHQSFSDPIHTKALLA